MTGGRFARISRAEAFGHEGQTHEARAALCSLAQDTTEILWARVESVQALARLGLKDDAVRIAHAMRAESPAEDEEDDQTLEIAELLAQLGEGPTFLLAILRRGFDGRGRTLDSALKTLGSLGHLDELLSLARDLDVSITARFGATETLIRFGRSEEAVAILQGWANPTAEVKNTAWYKELAFDAGLRLLAAQALIRYGRIEEGKGTLLGLVNPTTEIKNASGYSEEHRWAAGKALSQFPEHRQLVEQVWEEIARTEKYMKAYNIKVRRGAIMKLKENKQVGALLDIESNRSTPAELRKYIAAALGELGHTRDAEAIARDIEPT